MAEGPLPPGQSSEGSSPFAALACVETERVGGAVCPEGFSCSLWGCPGTLARTLHSWLHPAEPDADNENLLSK